jgi:hypothetical protein
MINSNCTQILFNIPVPNNATGAVTIEVTNGDGTVQNFPAVAVAGFVTINVNMVTSGVVSYAVIRAGNVLTTGTLVSGCEIDCCLAKLVESAINCTCKCDKCKEELMRAEKIYLLLAAAKFAAEIENNYDDAVAKYNKAREFCTEVCACGC